jgi:sigma-E factor negative regulatory protein RseC
MSENEAVVTRVDGDHIWVDVNSRSSCSSCEQAAGCGLGDGKGKPPQRMRNLVGARVGDIVSIDVPDGAVIKAAVLSYLLPLAIALSGAAAGMAIGGDGTAVLGAIVGLLIGWIGLRQAARRFVSFWEPLLTMRIKGVVVHQLHRNRLP